MREIFELMYMAQTAMVGPGPPIIEASRSHSGAPQSVVLLWMSDQPTLRPSPDKTQHSPQTGFHAPGGIRTHNSSKRASTQPRLRLRGQRESIGFEPFI